MKKLKLNIELEYDDEGMHGNEGEDADALDWFINTILKGDGLILHERGELDDEIGTVKVLKIF